MRNCACVREGFVVVAVTGQFRNLFPLRRTERLKERKRKRQIGREGERETNREREREGGIGREGGESECRATQGAASHRLTCRAFSPEGGIRYTPAGLR